MATYKSLAAAIGSPKAFRAVGSALRKNPYAPVVPCHRVVASDLTLGIVSLRILFLSISFCAYIFALS
ncbi:MGMT family protein [archaeon]|nr:MAG: MGMT family protein [archaeon]